MRNTLLSLLCPILLVAAGGWAAPQQQPPLLPAPGANLSAELPPDDGSVKLSRVETACLASGGIIWPADDICYRLLEQGPCQRGSWLVLDASGTRVECRPRRCPCDAARTDLCEIEVEKTGECHVATAAGQEGLCGAGEQLVATPRGYGVCGCITRPPHVLWRPEEESAEGRCYPLYQQGPCAAGYQLRYSPASQEAVCQPALCQDGSVLMAEDGACHRLDQPGSPCADDLHVLSLDPTTLEPSCQLIESRVKRVLLDIPIPTGVVTDAPLPADVVTQDCRLDASGRCVKSRVRPRGGGGAGAARGYVSWLKSFRS